MLLHHVGLLLHMIGILLAGGGSIGAILAETQLWKRVGDRSGNAKAYMPIIQSATFFIYAGMITFIVSGLIMLYSVNWAYLSQPWFIAKLVLFLMLPIRGAMVGKAIVMQIGTLLNQDPGNLPALMKLKTRMQRFHTIQYALVITIIFLVIFKV